LAQVFLPGGQGGVYGRQGGAQDLAVLADLPSGIERGVRNPTWSKLCGLADALGIPISVVAAEAEHDTCPVCGALSSE
jgi:transcriptional regulator with XRE-family HTH domain